MMLVGGGDGDGGTWCVYGVCVVVGVGVDIPTHKATATIKETLIY